VDLVGCGSDHRSAARRSGNSHRGIPAWGPRRPLPPYRYSAVERCETPKLLLPREPAPPLVQLWWLIWWRGRQRASAAGGKSPMEVGGESHIHSREGREVGSAELTLSAPTTAFDRHLSLFHLLMEPTRSAGFTILAYAYFQFCLNTISTFASNIFFH
jgi:hypothetical protein